MQIKDMGFYFDRIANNRRMIINKEIPECTVDSINKDIKRDLATIAELKSIPAQLGEEECYLAMSALSAAMDVCGGDEMGDEYEKGYNFMTRELYNAKYRNDKVPNEYYKLMSTRELLANCSEILEQEMDVIDGSATTDADLGESMDEHRLYLHHQYESIMRRLDVIRNHGNAIKYDDDRKYLVSGKTLNHLAKDLGVMHSDINAKELVYYKDRLTFKKELLQHQGISINDTELDIYTRQIEDSDTIIDYDKVVSSMKDFGIVFEGDE